MLHSLFQIIAPDTCISCNSIGCALCVDCRCTHLPKQPSVCYRCNRLTKHFRTCLSCRSSSKLFSLHKLSRYEGAARHLIVEGKYRSHRSYYEFLGRMLAELLRSDNVSVDFVSYIPSDPKRVRQRGYDHAHFLAKQVAVVLKTPMVNKFVRTAHNQQVGSNRFVRKSQFANSIQYIGSEIAGQAVLLVDDVLSTGTSMEVVAEELKKHGAKRVYGAVVAHNR